MRVHHEDGRGVNALAPSHPGSSGGRKALSTPLTWGVERAECVSWAALARGSSGPIVKAHDHLSFGGLVVPRDIADIGPRQIELIKDLELEFHYHPGKANIVAML